MFEQPCGQRLVGVLRTELDRLRSLGEVRCNDALAAQLKEISASTIDRLLARECGTCGGTGIRRCSGWST